MKKILLGLGAITIIIIAIFSWSHFSQQQRKVQAEEFFWQGRKAAISNDDLQALEYLTKAVQIAPENAEFNYYAGISARNMDKKELAYNFFQQAWDLGMKEPQVFLNMNATSALPKLDRSKFFKNMVHALKDEQSRLELSALLEFQQERLNAAANLLKKLMLTHPEGIYAEFYAQILVKLHQPEEALEMLKKIESYNKLNTNCYIILSEIYVAIDDMKAAASLFKKATENGMNSAEVTYSYARSLFYYGATDKAQKLLKTITIPKLFTPNDISSVTIFKKALKSYKPLAKIFLNHSNSTIRDMLLSTKDDRFTKNKFIELITTALNKFCKDATWFEPGLIDPATETTELKKLSQKKNLTTTEIFMRNALTLVNNFPDSLKLPDYSFTTHNARVILQIIASIDQNIAELEKLQSAAAGSRRWLEGERHFADYLFETIAEKALTEKAQTSLTAAVALLNKNDVVQITLANSLIAQEKYQDALVVLDKESSKNIIISRSPMVLQIKASSMIASGNIQGAQKILLSLFKRGYITENVVYELSRVSLALNDVKTANIAMKILDKYAVKSPRLYLLKAQILLQGGNFTATIETVKALLRSKVDSTLKDSGILLKARAELSQGQYQATLDTLQDLASVTPQSKLLKAEALHKLSKTSEALELILTIDPIPNNAISLYATLLAAEGKLEAAAEQLQKLIKINPDNIAAHLNLALIFNSLDKSDEASREAEKVLQKAPNNIRANLLLAQIALATGKTTEAASLAQKILTFDPKNQVALQILPSAYNAAKWYGRAITSCNYGLKLYPDNPFLIMQKTVALVGISDILEAKKDSAEDLTENTSFDTDLADEVTALTKDIHYTGGMRELPSNNHLSQEDQTLEFRNRSSKELLREAIALLDTINTQSAAIVYKLELQLKLHEKDKVLQAIRSGKLSENELFSLGVITDRRKDWDISTETYHAALKFQPHNPIILNNFAWAAAMSAQPVINQEMKDLLLRAAEEAPLALKGDIKAINTAAMVYNYLNEPAATIKLSKTYPDKFRYSPKLEQLLNKATDMLQNKNDNPKRPLKAAFKD